MVRSFQPNETAQANPFPNQVPVEDKVGFAGDSAILLDNLRLIPSVSACDFNTDGACNETDINMMFSQGGLVTGVPVTLGSQYDRNGDSLIDGDDIGWWLSDAAVVNGYSSTYRPGDTDGLGTVSPENRTVDRTW